MKLYFKLFLLLMLTPSLGYSGNEGGGGGNAYNPKQNLLKFNESLYYIINELKEHFSDLDAKICAYDQELANTPGMTPEKKGKLVAYYMSSDISEYVFEYGHKYYYGIGKVSKIPGYVKAYVQSVVHCSKPLYIDLAKNANCKFVQNSKTGKQIPDWRNTNGQPIVTPLSTIIREYSEKCYHLDPKLLTNYEIN